MKIEVVGNVAVISSKYSVEEIRMVENRAPEALRIEDEKTNATKFQITTRGNEGMNANCLCFANNGVNGKASLTIPVSGDIQNVRAALTEKYGTTILRANTVEVHIHRELANIASQNREIENLIEIHGVDDCTAHGIDLDSVPNNNN